MRAHLVQMDIAWEDRQENYRRARGLVERAGVERGDLVVLPEMFDTGFSFRLERTSDGAADAGGAVDGVGATLGFLRELAAELGATVHGGRTVVGADGRGRNRATIIGADGSVLVEYDKVHPFSYGKESEFFTGGDKVVTYTWMHAAGLSVERSGGAGVAADREFDKESGEDGLVVCAAVCYDLRFPELFRLGLLAGAEAFAIGANWPAARAGHWRALLIARAIENQAFVFGVNRCGKDPHLSYAGGTMAVGPKGEVLGEMGGEEEVLSVEVDVGVVREWRGVFPAWRDVRLVARGDGAR